MDAEAGVVVESVSKRPRTLLACLDLDLICSCGATYKRRDFYMRYEAVICSCGARLRWRCPFVSCCYHLYGEVRAGTYRSFRDPDFSRGPLEFAETCVLDASCVGHTLEEVGTLFSITRERVRQIDAKGLRILRTKLGRMDLTPEPRYDDPNIFVIPAGYAWSFRDVKVPRYPDRSGQYDDHVRAWRVATITPAHSKPKPVNKEKWIFDPWRRK